MLKKLFIVLLYILSMSVNADVYKCIHEYSIRFSSHPCDEDVLDDNNGDFQSGFDRRYKLVMPIFSGWKNGWIINKEVNLEHFTEVVYESRGVIETNNRMFITLQKSTDLPNSMTTQQFAFAIADIIESICIDSYIYQPTAAPHPSNIFYGQYSCSLRRDTLRGELGSYKIMRANNSIYMVMVKWNVSSFTNAHDKSISIIEDIEQKQKITAVQQYLQNEVKLCRGNKCF